MSGGIDTWPVLALCSRGEGVTVGICCMSALPARSDKLNHTYSIIKHITPRSQGHTAAPFFPSSTRLEVLQSEP